MTDWMAGLFRARRKLGSAINGSSGASNREHVSFKHLRGEITAECRDSERCESW